jgi:hypothetical protein
LDPTARLLFSCRPRGSEQGDLRRLEIKPWEVPIIAT